MAAGNWIPYTINMTDEVLSGGIDLDTDTIVCVLLGSGYTPNRTGHSLWSDVSAQEKATAGGYTQGGVALANKANTHSAGTGTWDADDIAWATATFTAAKYAVLVKRAGGSLVSGDKLIAYLDLNTGGGTVDAGGGTFTIQLAAGGILSITANAS